MNRIDEPKLDYSKIMYERWHKANDGMNTLDQKDIMEDSPMFNLAKKKGPKNQHHPEFT